MSEKAPAPALAHLAQGNVRVKAGAAPPRTVDSPYGDSIREKQVQSSAADDVFNQPFYSI